MGWERQRDGLQVLLVVQIIIEMERQELIVKVNELENENEELKQSLDQVGQRLREERELWNEEHAQLKMEIQLLRDEVARLEGSIDEIHQRNLELQAENEHICYELTSLQMAHQNIKERVTSNLHESFKQPQEASQQNSRNRNNSEQYTIPTALHYQYTTQYTTQEQSSRTMFKSVPLIKSQSLIPCSAHMEDNQYDLKVFLVEDGEPHDPSYRQDSLSQQRHSLRGSLRALNMIDNYSAAGKEHSEHSSVFTSKYFKYQEENNHPQEKTQHQSRIHIPEQPQLQNLMTQRNIDSQHQLPSIVPAWWQRASYFLSGTCLGLYLFWQLGHG